MSEGFIAQLLILNVYLLYTMSAVLGIGAALIWTAQVSGTITIQGKLTVDTAVPGQL